MKATLKTLAMLLLAGMMGAACSDSDDDGNGGNGGNGGDGSGSGTIAGVTVDNLISGPVKAGFADQIEITGSGFDAEQDWVYVGYEKEGAMVYTRITDDVLTIRSGRISFGVSVDADFLDQTIRVYLDRAAIKMAISGELTFTMPTVAEGYIPDPYFRATLRSTSTNEGNPNAAALFNAYGLIDVTSAAALTSAHPNYALNLYNCAAESLEGIELFSGVSGLVAGWNMTNIKVLDLSGWEAKGVELLFNGCPKLEKFIGSPYCYRARTYDSPNCTYVDVHNCDWLTWLEISNYESYGESAPNSAVTYFDIRRNCSGTYADKPTQIGQMAMVWNNANQGFKVADNATIKIDTHFLWDHTSVAWKPIYEAWKNQGATIEVYSRIDPYRDELLGTAPSVTEDPDALSPDGKNGSGQPSNKWQVDDPYTEENEAPVPYVPPGA